MYISRVITVSRTTCKLLVPARVQRVHGAATRDVRLQGRAWQDEREGARGTQACRLPASRGFNMESGLLRSEQTLGASDHF